jgi:hypothetical protein
VVGSDLPALQELAAAAGPGVVTASDPATFADAVVRAATAVPDVRATDARRRFAAQHDWSHRARRFAELIGVTTTGAPAAVAGASSHHIAGGAGQ